LVSVPPLPQLLAHTSWPAAVYLTRNMSGLLLVAHERRATEIDMADEDAPDDHVSACRRMRRCNRVVAKLPNDSTRGGYRLPRT
jgi:hypothetical protein